MFRHMQGRRKEILYFGVLAGIFLWMFVCNILTKWIADDFAYIFSFADGKRIQSILQIPESMLAHAKTMNGRLTAHGLVQLFGMLPDVVFDIVNSLMCVLLVALLERFVGGKQDRNPLLALAVFAALWLFTPAFGQIFLWQDGAINYLWSGCFSILLLYRMAQCCLFDHQVKTVWGKIGICILAYVAGSYLESTSAALILCMFILMVIRWFYLKKKILPYMATAFCIALAGYIGIFLAPAQWMNKSGALGFAALLFKGTEALERFSVYGVLLAAFVVMICLCSKEKTDRVYLLLAGTLVCGSVLANFIHIFATGFPERGAFAAGVFLIAADAVLLHQLLKSVNLRMLTAAAMIIMVLAAVTPLAIGLRDIASTYSEMKENETHIAACRQQGVMEVEIKTLEIRSRYSVAYGLKYIDTETSETWPNDGMAVYYGVDSIVGKEP